MNTESRPWSPDDPGKNVAGQECESPPRTPGHQVKCGRAALALSRTLLFGLLAWVVPASLRPCTTFCLERDTSVVFGRNYDYYAADGRVIVNRRGLQKSAFSTNSGLQWVSRFGSLTFNQFGLEFPNGGINEAGLVVEHMMLEGSQYPGDARPSLTELQWIQYQLDCSASVADVIASDQRIRIQPGSTPLHFLVADSTGRCAVIEFLGGQLVCHTEGSLPVAALTNNTYDDSLAYAAVTPPGQADHVSSLGRFVQVAASVRNFAQSPAADPIAYAFAALDNVNQPNWTRWSIVYDVANRTAYFRTQPASLVKQIRLAALDFGSDAPIRMMDINAAGSGEVIPQSIYSAADNLALLTSVYRQTTPLANVSAAYIQRRAAFPDSVAPFSPPLIVSTLAGQPLSGGATDGTGAAARFYELAGIAADNAGNLYVADTGNHTIRRIAVATGAVTTLAGLAGSSGSADGTGAAARFNSPSGVVVDGAGNLFVADTLNHTVRRVTAPGVVTTLAGSAGTAGSSDGTGSAARFHGPQGLALDGGGNFYVADTNNHAIRLIVPATGVVTTVAGMAGIAGSADGLGAFARFNFPSGIAVNGVGVAFVADTENHTIRQVLPSGLVTTVAGLAGANGAVDASGGAARFDSPAGVAVDPSGNLYVVDTDNHTIRKVAPSIGAVTTLAGLAGTSGSADGLGSAARLFGPAGIAVGNDANLYVADANNDTVRAGLFASAPGIQTQPQSQTVTSGSNVQLSVTASGRPALAYQWYFNGTAISGATSNTYSLSSVQAGNAGAYTVAITNAMGTVTSDQATLTVTAVAPPPSGGSGGGGGGGGATGAWFLGALLLLAAIRRHQRRAPCA